MKTLFKYILTAVIIGLMIIPMNDAFAGNKDRTGEAGGNHLLINPWGRSSGWGGVSTGSVKGVESMFINVAGLAFTEGTDIAFSNTNWLSGSNTNIISFGLAQSIGDGSVIGLNVMSMSFDDIMVTTTGSPDGGIGTYSPNIMYIGLSYAKAFSNSIYGGMQVKMVTEGIDNVTASGVAIDAGIQYVTGDNEEIKFGITLRNWGPTMKFSGSGLTLQTLLPGQDNMFTVSTRSVEFELPSQLNIGTSYDILFGEDNRWTIAGQFASNAFTNDQYTLGTEVSLRKYVQLRGSYTYEEGINAEITSGDKINAHKGLSAGITVQAPLNKESGSFFSIDYAYRQTVHFHDTHTIGVRLNF